MGDLMSYSGLTTKIRAMHRNIISKKEYQEISNLTSVAEFVSYLQHHPSYKELFASMEISKLHRGDIERLLIYSVYKDFTKIYSFANIKQRQYLDLYFMRYEIAILKRCLRMVFDHRNVSLDLSIFETFFKRHSKIDIIKLSESTSIEDLVANLKGSMYYDAFWKLSNLKDLTLFDYEMCLDLFLFNTIWKTKKKYFKGEELDMITHSYGSRIDVLNIQWIFRSKKYYNISAADIYAMLLPINYRLSKSDITALVEAGSMDEFADVLKGTYYWRHYAGKIESPDLESLYKKILSDMNLKDYKSNPYSVATINYYLYKKEQERSKLVTAVECIRYGFDSKEVAKYII